MKQDKQLESISNNLSVVMASGCALITHRKCVEQCFVVALIRPESITCLNELRLIYSRRDCADRIFSYYVPLRSNTPRDLWGAGLRFRSLTDERRMLLVLRSVSSSRQTSQLRCRRVVDSTSRFFKKL